MSVFRCVMGPGTCKSCGCEYSWDECEGEVVCHTCYEMAHRAELGAPFPELKGELPETQPDRYHR